MTLPGLDPERGNTVEVAGVISVAHRLLVAVSRENAPRRRCATCKVRRVLYRIAVAGWGGEDMTEARCAECWGITP